MCPDQVNAIHEHALGRNEPTPVDERQRYAAWKFYCTVLGGRQVWPFGIARANGRLWFKVGDVVIEAGPQFGDARARMGLAAEVAEDSTAPYRHRPSNLARAVRRQSGA